MSDSDNAVVDSIAVELSNSSYKEREPVWNEGEGDPDKGGGVCSNEAIRTELGLELVAKIAVIPVVRSEAVPPVSILVIVGVVGGKEEGGRDDMVRATWACTLAGFRIRAISHEAYEILCDQTAMPQCLSCGKILPSNDAIQRHMNQPTSRCHGWVDNLVRLSEIEEVEGTNLRQGTRVDQYCVSEDRNPPFLSRFGGVEAMDIDMGAEPILGLADEFPGAAKIFPGERQTFLGAFDGDTFSNERQYNPYYLFASRPDWEFGLWLTCSGLSLAAMDSLLSLELVGPSNTN